MFGQPSGPTSPIPELRRLARRDAATQSEEQLLKAGLLRSADRRHHRIGRAAPSSSRSGIDTVQITPSLGTSGPIR